MKSTEVFLPELWLFDLDTHKWQQIAFNIPYSLPFILLTHLLVPPLAAITQPWIAQYGGWLPIRPQWSR